MLITQRPTIEEESVNESRSRFIVEPLEPGFGYTLGNTMRRTLLSRIPGAAITSVRIEGVQHEFSTIEGVVEDVVDFILNLKQVAHISVPGLGPKVSVLIYVDQLSCNPQFASSYSYAALQEDADIQFLADLLNR